MYSFQSIGHRALWSAWSCHRAVCGSVCGTKNVPVISWCLNSTLPKLAKQTESQQSPVYVMDQCLREQNFHNRSDKSHSVPQEKSEVRTPDRSIKKQTGSRLLCQTLQYFEIVNNSCFVSLFPQAHWKGWGKSELVLGQGKVTRMLALCVQCKNVEMWFSPARQRGRHIRDGDCLQRGCGCWRWRGENLDQVRCPSAVRAARTPKRFWLWSKYKPSGPLPAPGHTNPRPFHIPLLFSWLQNASGYPSRCFFSFPYLLIKCALVEPKKPWWALLCWLTLSPVLSRHLCATYILFTEISSLYRCAVRSNGSNSLAECSGAVRWWISLLNWGISQRLCHIKHPHPQLQQITFPSQIPCLFKHLFASLVRTKIAGNIRSRSRRYTRLSFKGIKL